jgi:hypothetical protein
MYYGTVSYIYEQIPVVLDSVVDPDPGSGSVLDPYSSGPLDPDP